MNVPLYYGEEPNKSACDQVFDVCIIGSGASGSIAANKLVKGGFNVLMLEQGPFINEHTTYDDVLLNSEPAYVRDAVGNWTLAGYPWSTCNVGGGTVFYGGASFRYREVDFNPEAYFKYADFPLVWPYTYEELAPFYDEVEKEIGISGDPSKDPLTPKGHMTLPMPPVEISKAGRLIKEAALKLGLNPFPTPMSIVFERYKNRFACEHSSPCIEHFCLRGAKADACSVFLKDLCLQENFTLYAGLKACFLERRNRSQVSSVNTYHIKSKKSYTFKAKNFVIACNAIQSASLLLRSKDKWSPQGIGNETDMVGRGLCFKLSRYVSGYTSSSKGDLHDNTNNGPFSTVAITDYYIDKNCPTNVGGLIYEAKHGYPFNTAPADNILRLECLIADQPMFNNRIRLVETDIYNNTPRVMIDYRPHPMDLARLEYLTERAEELLRKAGCQVIFREESGFEFGSTHLHGTCRAGNDPKTSVLNRDSRLHSSDNVYIIDGSFMPYPGGVNPTLTIQAHALKVATYLSQKLR